MTLVLVEGESDAVAVRILARRRGLAEPELLPVGGSTGARRAAREHPGRRMIGLVDAGERRHFERVLDTVFVCAPDLEGEFVRAIGAAGIEAVIAAQGGLASFRRLQQQPYQVGRTTEQHLARFLAGRSGNKVRHARLLAEAVPLAAVPPPLAALLDELESAHELPHSAEAEPAPGSTPDAEHGSHHDEVVATLRSAGCVFAEDEAAHLRATATDDEDLAAIVARRVAGEPLEHVVGRVDLDGRRLSVGPGVFVPRRRTALLVETTLAVVREIVPAPARARATAAGPDPAAGGPVVVEAYAGVAPVASAVRADIPAAQVHATDVDATALTHAARNLGDAGPVHRGAVLGGLPPALRGRVDVVAAVPPYVPRDAIGMLPREARDHEPAAALDGGEDGLDAVRELMTQARDWLAPGGRVLVEIHRDQVAPASDEARVLGYEARHVDGEDGQTAVLVLERMPRQVPDD